MHLLIQIAVALCVGTFYYLIAMAMTVYDGILSLIGQPIMGGLVSLVAILLLLLVGLPLRLVAPVHRWWRQRWWLPLVLGAVGFAMMWASWLPEFRRQIYDPDLRTMADTFHPVLAIGGWLLTLFAVLHFYPPWFPPTDRSLPVSSQNSRASVSNTETTP